MSESRKKGGGKKYGRNKRAVDNLMSAYVRDKITFDQYYKGKKAN